jgi:nocardicin N-oxygenase
MAQDWWDALTDPHPFYAYLRKHDPISRCSEGTWLVTTHAEGCALLAHDGFSHWAEIAKNEGKVGCIDYRQDWLSLLAATNKSKIRHQLLHVLASSFSLKSEEAAMFQHRAAAIESKLQSAASVELVAEYCKPIASVSAAAMLGISQGNVSYFCDLLSVVYDDLLSIISGCFPTDPARWYSFETLLQAEFDHPLEGTLLHSLLACVKEYPDRKERALRYAELFIFAGTNNLATSIASAAEVMLFQDAAVQRLYDTEQITLRAVDEVLRFHSPVQLVRQMATEEVKYRGRVFKPGDQVFVSIASANRDDLVFVCPDEIDFQRAPNPHLTFGRGAAACIGAGFARRRVEAAMVGLRPVLRTCVKKKNTLNFSLDPPVMRRAVSLIVDRDIQSASSNAASASFAKLWR